MSRFRGVQTETLGDRSVARIVQRAAAAAGLEPATVAGHSLRAGLITTAAKSSYIRHAGMFDTTRLEGV